LTYSIAWAHAALFTFYRLPIHSATLADRAVTRFAETGEGHVEWVAPYHRLRAGVYDLALRVDRDARSIAVLYIYRAR
jgi:hypothetical protein